MGMYFRVKKDESDKCPYCNEPIQEWQSKEDIGFVHDVWGGCCQKHANPLPTLEKNQVKNFYEICSNCHKWVEYKNVEGKFELQEDSVSNK